MKQSPSSRLQGSMHKMSPFGAKEGIDLNKLAGEFQLQGSTITAGDNERTSQDHTFID